MHTLVQAENLLSGITKGFCDELIANATAHQKTMHDANGLKGVLLTMQNYYDKGLFGFYLHEESVIKLAADLTPHKGSPCVLPQLDFVDLRVSVRSAVNNGMPVELITWLLPYDGNLFVVEYMRTETNPVVGMSVYIQRNDGRVAPCLMPDNMEENGGTHTRVHQTCIIHALLDNRHVSVQDRVNKTRTKIKGKVQKNKTHYKHVYIDVNKDVAAHNTVGNGKGTPKSLHAVRSFLRMRLGKVELVRAHLRGRGRKEHITIKHIVAK